jgi:hypothetical protein
MGRGVGCRGPERRDDQQSHVAASSGALALRLDALRAACAELDRPYKDRRIVAAASPSDDPAVLRAYAELACTIATSWSGATQRG